MSYILQLYNNKPQQLTMNSNANVNTEMNTCESIPEGWNSIFIPRIDYRYNFTLLKQLFEENKKIGVLDRVDFVKVPEEKGSGRMAFVHFQSWNEDEYDCIYFKSTIEKYGLIDYEDHVVIDNCPKVFNIRMLINKNPVPPTRLNVNQLSDSFTRLNVEFEDYKQETEAKIQKQQTQIDALIQEIMQIRQFAHNVNMIQMHQMGFIMPSPQPQIDVPEQKSDPYQ